MKSNLSSAAGAAVPAQQYDTLRSDGWSHSWNVSINARKDPSLAASRHILDFYHKETTGTFPRNTSSTVVTGTKFLDRAYPRHHALVLAALGSSSKLASREFPKHITCGYERGYANLNDTDDDVIDYSWFKMACARVHDPSRVTPFTELSSTYQKHHLTSMAGLTGLLVTRLMTGRHGSNGLYLKTKKKVTEITKQYIHSALAAECLISNRYYRNRAMCSEFKQPVGFIDCNSKANITDADITPEALNATQDELREAYNANIDRLVSMVAMFKRGFVSIRQIREDPEFIRMMTAFWRNANQLSKVYENFERQPIHNASPLSLLSLRKEAKRATIISMISELDAVAPMLYHYDIAHVFDNANKSYSNYVKVTKHTLVRLANDGSTAAFLAFAAIEPLMVTEEYAPKIGGALSEYHTFSLKSCANYIPSKHPVFGALRMKHRCHIVRTADAMNASSEKVHSNANAPLRGVERDNERFQPSYAPFYEKVEDTRICEYKVDTLRQFPETKRNTGKVISAYEANCEFHQRVYPYGRAVTVSRDDDDDDDDDVYSDDEYDCRG